MDDLDQLSLDVTAFIIDRQARRLSPRTIEFYQDELRYMMRFIQSVDPGSLRMYLIELGTHRNPGGVDAAYRAMKVFFTWRSRETGAPNPMDRIAAPKVDHSPRPGISLDHVRLLLATCDKSFVGLRDRAIILSLLDTGLRRNEFTDLNRADLDLKTGSLLVRNGKGNKPRVVYVGVECRKQIIRYLRLSPPEVAPLWLTDEHTRISPDGLRQILRRRAQTAGIPAPGLHEFRRAFALQMLRAGCDIYTLMALMGHTSPVILMRYLRLAQSDIQAAHARSSPADNML